MQNTELSDIRAYSKNGVIYIVNNEALEPVSVYTTQGVKIYEGMENVISSGIEKDMMYVVRIGSHVTKVMVK